MTEARGRATAYNPTVVTVSRAEMDLDYEAARRIAACRSQVERLRAHLAAAEQALEAELEAQKGTA